ncbi:hypothetical protein ACNTMW_11730 [Planosporangium sp. 12N6]|uniref:hypothetical protein n=1 Tax=Planosporangium spinosum TaxID=3402278 RepID=UPI003CED8A8D
MRARAAATATSAPPAPASPGPVRVRRTAARPAVVAALVAVVLTAAYLLAPPLGTDLSAQVARAGFFDRHGLTPIDFGWYGGVSSAGYSLVSPALMTWLGGGLLGARLAGALAAVVSAVALALLLARTGARRPALAGAIGAVCFVGNLVSGRTTYAVGVAFGLLALVALTLPARRQRMVAAVAGAALAALTSPVAGLFVGLAGVALVASRLFAGRRSTVGPSARTDRARAALGRIRPALDGLLVALGAAVPMGVTSVVFGSGGWMNISRSDTVHAVVTSLAVAVLVPRRAVRIGASLSALGVLAACLLHTPVGLNATRLATMFALPVLAGYADLGWVRRSGAVPRRLAGAALPVVLLATAGWQPPVLWADLADAGNPVSSREYVRPLREELARRAPVGRVEVIPTRDYWEAAYLPDVAPLARGWLRQADLAYHPLFFDGALTADRYHSWLRENGVSYVALAGAEPSWVGQREATLVRGGLPYLSPVWHGGGWVLYRVAGDPSIVSGARLVSSGPGGVTMEVPAAGDVLVRVRYSRWLAVRGPAAAEIRRQGEWSLVTVSRPGRYTVTSALR